MHHFAEWMLDISLTSAADNAFLSDNDNSSIVATDSIKNAVYKLAKQLADVTAAEKFAVLVCRYFLQLYPSIVSGVEVGVKQRVWSRVVVEGGQEHSHGFVAAPEKRTCRVVMSGGTMRAPRIESGFGDLEVLKTTQSGFEGFIRDHLTLLPETRERIVATSITARWTYLPSTCAAFDTVDFNGLWAAIKGHLLGEFFGPADVGVYSPSVQRTLYLMGSRVIQRVEEVAQITLQMPNLHFIPYSNDKLKVRFEDDIYFPTDEPHGSIEATVSRRAQLAKF